MSLWNWDLKKIIFLKSSRLLPFYKYRQGRYTNFPWKIFGNHVVCWTFSVANKSGHFSFGSFCVISFTTQGFLWFLGNQCSKARVVQCRRLWGFLVQKIYYSKIGFKSKTDYDGSRTVFGSNVHKCFTVQSQRLDARWEEENCRSSRQKPFASSIGIIDSLHPKAASTALTLGLLHWFPKNQRKLWVVKGITQNLL